MTWSRLVAPEQPLGYRRVEGGVARAFEVGRPLWQTRVLLTLKYEGARVVERLELGRQRRVGRGTDCRARRQLCESGRLKVSDAGRTVGHRLGPQKVALRSFSIPADGERLLDRQQVVQLVRKLDLVCEGGQSTRLGSVSCSRAGEGVPGSSRRTRSPRLVRARLDLRLLAPERRDARLVGTLFDDEGDVRPKQTLNFGKRTIGVLDSVVEDCCLQSHEVGFARPCDEVGDGDWCGKWTREGAGQRLRSQRQGPGEPDSLGWLM